MSIANDNNRVFGGGLQNIHKCLYAYQVLLKYFTDKVHSMPPFFLAENVAGNGMSVAGSINEDTGGPCGCEPACVGWGVGRRGARKTSAAGEKGGKRYRQQTKRMEVGNTP